MKVEISKQKYEKKYLIVLFAFMIGFLILTVLVYSLITGEVWYTKIHLLFPGILGGAIGGMVGARRMRMRLTNISNPDQFRTLFSDYMNTNFRAIGDSPKEEEKVYAPPRWDLRLFQHWMGQEDIVVSAEGAGYEIVAPKHSLDRIEAYVRFNKEIGKTH